MALKKVSQTNAAQDIPQGVKFDPRQIIRYPQVIYDATELKGEWGPYYLVKCFIVAEDNGQKKAYPGVWFASGAFMLPKFQQLTRDDYPFACTTVERTDKKEYRDNKTGNMVYSLDIADIETDEDQSLCEAFSDALGGDIELMTKLAQKMQRDHAEETVFTKGIGTTEAPKLPARAKFNPDTAKENEDGSPF